MFKLISPFCFTSVLNLFDSFRFLFRRISNEYEDVVLMRGIPKHLYLVYFLLRQPDLVLLRNATLSVSIVCASVRTMYKLALRSCFLYSERSTFITPVIYS